MTSYVVEVYTPATAELGRIETAARQAAAEMATSGTPVRYVRSIFLPLEEICFHLLDGPSADAVREVAGRAGIEPQRILEAAGEETATIDSAYDITQE